MWKKLMELWSQDYNPRLTKFITITFMPLLIFFLFFWGIRFNQLTKITLETTKNRQGVLEQVEKEEFGEKGKYGYRMRFDDSNDEYYLSHVMIEKSENLDKLSSGVTANLHFIEAFGKNDIVFLAVDSNRILDLELVKSHYGKLRTMIFFFATLFSIWFVSRIYRYKKKG